MLCLEHLSGVPAHAAAILERVSLRAWVQLLRESSIAAVRMAVPGMLQRVLFGGNAAEVGSHGAVCCLSREAPAQDRQAQLHSKQAIIFSAGRLQEGSESMCCNAERAAL